MISGPADFQAAKVAILTLVSINERAWSRAYGEDERDLMIKYCKVQLDVIKGMFSLRIIDMKIQGVAAPRAAFRRRPGRSRRLQRVGDFQGRAVPLAARVGSSRCSCHCWGMATSWARPPLLVGSYWCWHSHTYECIKTSRYRRENSRPYQGADRYQSDCDSDSRMADSQNCQMEKR